MKKKILTLGIICLFGIVNTFAQSGDDFGIKWKIENGTLTISGNMDMWDYTPVLNEPPWYPYINSIEAVVIENGITSIGRFAFFYCFKMSSISIANSVTKIGANSFTNSGLQSIILPDGVAIIDAWAFSQCALTSITLPISITIIGDYALNQCPLTTVINLNPVPLDINADVFEYVNIKTCTLKVPKNSIDAYKKAPVWQDFKIVGIEVGIDEYEKETDNSGEQLLIYPNPNTGTCSIIIPEEFQNERFLTLSIYDNSGKKVQEISIDNENPAYSLKLDSKAAGVYVAVLSNGKRSVRGRIVFN